MSRYSVAIVLLSLIAGAAVGIVYENARQGGAAVRGVAETAVDVSTEAAAEEVAAASRAEVVRPEGVDENVVAAAGVPAVRAARRARRSGGRAATHARVSSRPVPARAYVRVTRREAGGGRSVAGYMAGGVKKTGAVVSKPFVKVGGLFHD